MDHLNINPIPPLSTTTNDTRTIVGWRPNPQRIRLRRRKLPYIRLGGNKTKSSKRLSLVRILRKIKLKWLKLQYACMIKKLKAYYAKTIRELIEASGSYESFQQRFAMESSFGIPIAAMSFSAYPTAAGPYV